MSGTRTASGTLPLGIVTSVPSTGALPPLSWLGTTTGRPVWTAPGKCPSRIWCSCLGDELCPDRIQFRGGGGAGRHQHDSLPAHVDLICLEDTFDEMNSVGMMAKGCTIHARNCREVNVHSGKYNILQGRYDGEPASSLFPSHSMVGIILVWQIVLSILFKGCYANCCHGPNWHFNLRSRFPMPAIVRCADESL